MILPESAQAGDILGIFSTDGRAYRGTVRVREVFPGPPSQIGFDTPLPVGTTKGDILCLIRRRDEGTQVEVTDNLVAPMFAYKDAIEAVQKLQAELEQSHHQKGELAQRLIESVRTNDSLRQDSVRKDEQLRNLANRLHQRSIELDAARAALTVPEPIHNEILLIKRRIKSSS